MTHVRAVEGAVALIEEFEHTFDCARAAHPLPAQGRHAQPTLAIYDRLTRFIVPLHKIVSKTMLKDEEVAAAQRDDIRQLFWDILGYFIGIIASAMVLVALLFKEFKQANRLLRVAHQAEAAASAAKAQLTRGDRCRAGPDRRPRLGTARSSSGTRTAPTGAGMRTARARPKFAEDVLDRQVFRTGQLVPFFEERSARAGTWRPHLADHQGAARGDGGPDHRGCDGFA